MSLIEAATQQEALAEGGTNPFVDWFKHKEAQAYSMRDRKKAKWAMNRKKRASRPYSTKQRRPVKQIKAGPVAPPRLHSSPVGHQVGSANTSKTWLAPNFDDVINSRELEIVDLTRVPHTSDNSINGRVRDSIYVGGFHIKMCLSNEQTSPTFFNYAVISPLTVNTVTNQQFFRYYDDFRSADFGTALTAQEFASLPINADKYHVHLHGSCLLAPTSGATNFDANATNSYRCIDRWVPFRKELRYSGGKTDASPESGATYLVYWCDTFGRSTGANQQLSVMKVQRQTITYFRDVGSMY